MSLLPWIEKHEDPYVLNLLKQKTVNYLYRNEVPVYCSRIQVCYIYSISHATAGVVAMGMLRQWHHLQTHSSLQATLTSNLSITQGGSDWRKDVINLTH
jgi:hypothetical protein